ncbi:MAG: capsular biosynthesis protein [Bacteroidetes bacterium]|nr:capsular biosynthesis protein [Bacteroidota bacterium]MBV6462242.1 Tyrosine-protein phosphatase YwqE [Flavobacteriales bacterium]WKZ74826.1 MAG: histidinol phosphatase [Vicingaceae bacterium]MCL4816048.1 histidinol phosphatase [Flavobacteriales bacterium]NOG95207.1 capsular biosynthesis protein [Bacteroidota bacterium]
MHWLKNIFSKKEKVTLELLCCDMHSHLIPGIDDGAKDLEQSIEMIRAFKELGYKKIITTPHIMSDYYKNTPDIILNGLEKVKNELAKNHIEIEIEAAAEYYLDENFEEKIKTKKLLSFGKNYVLFELSMFSEPPHLANVIFELQVAGYTPVLAHPERYPYWHKNIDQYDELRSKGVLLQLNLLSLTGAYSAEVKKTAQKLIDFRKIDFCGSDAHSKFHLQLLSENLHLPYFHKLMALELLNKTL